MSQTPATRRSSYVLAALGTVAHAVLMFILLVLYVSYVPAAKRMFDEFGLTLPWITLTVIKLSNWFCEYWWLLALPSMLFCAGDFVLTAVLGKKRGPLVAGLWVAGVALVLMLPAALAVHAIEMPKATLKEALAR